MLDLNGILNTNHSTEVKLIFIVMANSKDFTQLTLQDLQKQTSLSATNVKKFLKTEEFDIVRDWANSVSKMKSDDAHKYSNECKLVLLYLNNKTKKNFRNTDSNLRFIKERMKSGVTYEEMVAIIDKKVEDWTGDRVMEKYLRPETLFNATKFETYYAESKGEIVSQQAESVEVTYSEAELSIYACD
ncbi:MAG: conserved phage C-terminal domain-containing protein [Cetobacterium sp.]